MRMKDASKSVRSILRALESPNPATLGFKVLLFPKSKPVVLGFWILSRDNGGEVTARKDVSIE